MPTEVILPRVDMDMESGRLSHWHVAEGAEVSKGQLIFEIETDKAAMEVEAPVSGTIRSIVGVSPQNLPVGSQVALIYAPGEIYPATRSVSGAHSATNQDAEPRGSEQGDPPPAADVFVSPAKLSNGAPGMRKNRPATPLARRIARQRGLDLAVIRGTGPQGRVVSADLKKLGDDHTATAVTLNANESYKVSLGAPATQCESAQVLHSTWLAQGEGTPLVLVHGFGADLNGWRAFLSGQNFNRPVFALDLPGHGASPDPIGKITLEDLTTAVEMTLAAEGIDRFHLIGHSLGGAIAATLAARTSTGVRSLMLLAPAGLGPEINGAFLSGFLRACSEASLTPWLQELVVDPTVLNSAFANAVLRQRKEGAGVSQPLIASALFPDGTQAFSIRHLFGHLAIPAKVVVGIDDRIIPVRYAFGLPGTIALHAFAGVGHLPHLEIRAEVARITQELLRSAD